MAGVSLTLGYGIVKTSMVGMQTNAIVHTSLKEQDLIHTVRTTLGDETQCKKNLKPSLPTAGTKKTVSEIKKYGSDDSITSDDVSLIKATENFKNNPLIYIQKMELEVTTSDRTFVLYYKKPQLGSLSSPGTCTATDQTGCYFIACKMNYACSDSANACPSSSTLTACSPLNCAEGGAVVDTAQVNTIIQNKLKDKKCLKNPPGTGTQEFVKGFKQNATTKELEIDCDTPPAPTTLPTVRCPDNTFLKGFSFDADGTPQPDCACRGGKVLFEKLVVEQYFGSQFMQYATFFYDLRTPYQLVNTGNEREVVYSKTRFCNCPTGQNFSYNSQSCVTCKNGKRWLGYANKCVTCSGGGAYWGTQRKRGRFGIFKDVNDCKCPTGKKKKKWPQYILA